jgi:hypothetical protein
LRFIPSELQGVKESLPLSRNPSVFEHKSLKILKLIQ